MAVKIEGMDIPKNCIECFEWRKVREGENENKSDQSTAVYEQKSKRHYG